MSRDDRLPGEVRVGKLVLSALQAKMLGVDSSKGLVKLGNAILAAKKQTAQPRRSRGQRLN